MLNPNYQIPKKYLGTQKLAPPIENFLELVLQ